MSITPLTKPLINLSKFDGNINVNIKKGKNIQNIINTIKVDNNGFCIIILVGANALTNLYDGHHIEYIAASTPDKYTAAIICHISIPSSPYIINTFASVQVCPYHKKVEDKTYQHILNAESKYL